jgi:hypothetical protein
MLAIAVLSWPPPWVPVLINMPAYLPQKEPCAHCLPVLSQKAVVLGKLRYSLTRIGTITFELGGEVSVACRDTKEDTVKGFELCGVVEDRHVAGFGCGVHLSEDILGESFGNSRGVGVSGKGEQGGSRHRRSLGDVLEH